MNSGKTCCHIADELRAVVHVAEPTLRTLADADVAFRPAPDRWTIKEVLGHLIDSAANNHQRFVRAQFVPHLNFPKYEQNEWVSSQNYNTADWQGLIQLWSAYNLHLAHVIRNVSQDALERQCTIGNYEPVTLEFLIEDYVVHLKGHLKKIAERLKMDSKKFAS
jgi:hypothetical protein